MYISHNIWMLAVLHPLAFVSDLNFIAKISYKYIISENDIPDSLTCNIYFHFLCQHVH